MALVLSNKNDLAAGSIADFVVFHFGDKTECGFRLRHPTRCVVGHFGGVILCVFMLFSLAHDVEFFEFGNVVYRISHFRAVAVIIIFVLGYGICRCRCTFYRYLLGLPILIIFKLGFTRDWRAGGGGFADELADIVVFTLTK